MIHLIPFARFEFISYRSAGKVEAQLAELVDPSRMGRPSILSKRVEGPPFHGMVAGGTFNFRRTIGYRNSYQPIIVGTIQEEAGAVHIKGRMHPHPLALALTVLLLGWFLVAIVAPYFSQDNAAQLMRFLPTAIAIALFLYLATMALFNYEANKALGLLRETFGEQGDS
jgi:hypothetical protein